MKFFYILVVIILSSLIGTALGEIALFFIPNTSSFYSFLNSSISSPSFSINNFNLFVCSFSISIVFKITPATLIGLIVGCIYGTTKV